MTEALAKQELAPAEPKLKIDKFADGGVTCLRFAGMIDEQFDGKKLAANLRAGTLVLDLGGVQKISSFGIREWVDFVNAAGERTTRMILVECAPKVVDQLNMVQNFAGKGLVYSFYAPYRCDYCDADRGVLLSVDKDLDAIRSGKPPERPCASCGNPEYFDEDPATYFSWVANQAPFELEPPVAAFLAAKLNYAVTDVARRFRIDKLIEGRATYLKLAGDIDGAFPREKLAEGLEGTVVLDVSATGKIEPAGAAEWRALIAQIAPACERIAIVGAPPVFVERLTDDLGAKTQLASFAAPYACAKCGTTTSHLVDVEAHHEILKGGHAPELRCGDCGGPAACVAGAPLLARFASLAKPALDAPLRKLIASAGVRKVEKKPVVAAAPRSPIAGWLLATGVAIAAAAALVAAIFFVLSLRAKARAARTIDVGKVVARSADKRPPWIPASAAELSASCTVDDGMTCVGVSAYSDEGAGPNATAHAYDAALDEALASIAGTMAQTDPDFAELVEKRFARDRQAVLDQHDRNEATARESAVVTSLEAVMVPQKAATDYWEQYRGPDGKTRTLGFAQIHLSKDQIAIIRGTYAQRADALGATAISFYPSLAWRLGEGAGSVVGAQLVAAGAGPLRDIGLGPGDVILEVGGRNVTSASSFADYTKAEYERLQRDGGALKLLVRSGDARPREFTLNVPRVESPAVAQPVRVIEVQTPAATFGGGVNVWDKTGGGGVRDNPNE